VFYQPFFFIFLLFCNSSSEREKMKGFLIMACLAATFISFLSLVEHGRGQQISNPAFMLLWKSTVGATKRHARVDMRKLMEPLLNPPSSNEKRGTQQGFEANVVPQDSLQQIYGTGPLGLIEIQSAMASFNRPLFDYDSLVQQAYVVEYVPWAVLINLSPLPLNPSEQQS